jgi:hypothetical protein
VPFVVGEGAGGSGCLGVVFAPAAGSIKNLNLKFKITKI